MEQLWEGPWKAILHMKKIIDKFPKKIEENIEIATATTLQEWCWQAAKLQVRQASKVNRGSKSLNFWKLDKANAEAMQSDLKADF